VIEEYKNIPVINYCIKFYDGNTIRAITAVNISATLMIITNSGRTFMPCVSSSKKRSNPALAAGMGPLFSRFLLLLWLIGFNHTG
jgi:hypothetical protein